MSRIAPAPQLPQATEVLELLQQAVPESVADTRRREELRDISDEIRQNHYRIVRLNNTIARIENLNENGGLSLGQQNTNGDLIVDYARQISYYNTRNIELAGLGGQIQRDLPPKATVELPQYATVT
jgi:hypothetical protein